MRIFLLVTSLTLMGFTNINAQNYQTYFPGKTIVFGNQYEGLKFQKVDSVTMCKGNSVFWFFPNFYMEDYYCIQPNGPNWSGRKLIVRENGDNVFFNKHNDSILLKTSAELHTPWLAYENNGSYKIYAEVVHHDTLSFLGVTDSVKTIGFQVYDINDDRTYHVLNNKHLKISRNYGIINTFLFRDFPDYSVIEPHIIEYDIRGISSPELGTQNLSWKDVFDDFQPGDELHIVGESCYGDIFDTDCSKQNSIVKYLNRIDYQDSLMYTIERISSIKSIRNDAVTRYEYIHDTILNVIHFEPDMNFNKLSEESMIQGDVISYNFQSKKHLGSGKYVMTKTVDLNDHLQKISEDCWEEPTGHYFYKNNEYMKGLGGPYYRGMMDHNNYAERKLVFYNKGDETWGSPLSIVNETGIDSVDEPMISVFPNPARNFIWLKADIAMPVLFEIVDLHGSVLITELCDSKFNQIDTLKLKAGVYIYRVGTGELLYQTGKLIIK